MEHRAPPHPDRPAAGTSADLSPGLPLIGVLTMTLTLLIWASFSLSIRSIGSSALTATDVALIRFVVPALLLLPWLPSRLPALRALPWRVQLMVAGGAGVPFFLVAALGGQMTSAAHVSALIAGTTPLTFALVAWLIAREPVPVTRRPGLALIIVGVLLLVAGLGTGQAGMPLLAGAGVLLLASLLWSFYTHGLRLAGLDPLGGAMLITLPSALLMLLLQGAGLTESQLSRAPWTQIALFVGVQGLGVGLLSTLGYAVSVRLLGAQRCAMVGALAPALATLMAIPLLGEWPTPVGVAGVLAVCAGVVLAVRGTPSMLRSPFSAPSARS